MQIDHGTHCKAFSAARSVDTGEEKKKIHFCAEELVCISVCASASVCVQAADRSAAAHGGAAARA